jgi:hypothetical protein
VSYFLNVGEGSQWVPNPETLSPQVGDLDVAQGRQLIALPQCDGPDSGSDAGRPCARGGTIRVVLHESLLDPFFDVTVNLRRPHRRVSLVSERDGEVLDVSESTSFDPEAWVVRPPGVHVLNVYHGPAGDYGSGPLGVTPGYQFQILRMDGGGTFAKPETFPLIVRSGFVLGVEGLAGFDFQDGDASPEVLLNRPLESFALKGTLVRKVRPGPNEPSETRAYEVGYRWDEPTGVYRRFSSSRPIDAGR